MNAGIARRLQALERAVHAAAKGSGLPAADRVLLQRSMAVLLAHAPGVGIEDFGERLANETATDDDLNVLRQLAQAGQSDPAAFVRRVADLSRSV